MSVYPESRDYAALADLVEQGVEVVAWVDRTEPEGEPLRQLIRVRYSDSMGRRAVGIHVVAGSCYAGGHPGVSYIYANGRADFLAQCSLCNLSYIPPAIPSTELPTEEGAYWWRKDDGDQWQMVHIHGPAPFTVDTDRFSGLFQGLWRVRMGCIGQWVRIYKPGEA
jgi:hypothetical protein